MAWNGSDQTGRATSMKSPDSRSRRAVASSRRPYKRGILAGLIVVALGAVGIYCCLRPTDAVSRHVQKESKHSAIVTVKPANTNLPAKPTPRETAPTAKKDRNAGAKTYRDAQGILRYEGGARVFDPTRPRSELVKLSKRSIFKYRCENQIYALLDVAPGGTLFGTRHFDERFLEEFKRSLNDKIEISDEDSENDKILKQAMIETKDDLKKRMDAGEDICQILSDTYSEIMRLSNYRRDIEKMVRETSKNENLTDRDCEDLINAANEMLKSQGIAPLRKTVLLKKNIQLQNLRTRKQKDTK